MKQLSPLGQAALAYAERRWRVFPLIPGEKRPIISNIYRDSSCDPEQIRAWWTENPYSNIGLDCGNSGLAAIDIDPDKPGAAALPGIMLLSGGKRAWDTWTSKTPSGGRHYLFEVADTAEGEIPTSTGIYGEPGIDGRGKGGYIVLPPSKLLKGTYELVNDKRPTPVPRTLLLPTRGTRDLSGRTELQALLQDGERIQLGGRDNFLARVAGGLRRFGFDPREIEGLLLQTYHMRCVVDGTLTEEDIKRIAESAGKYEVADSLLKKAIVELETEGEWDENDGALAINSTVFLSEYKETTTWIVDGILQTNSLNQLIGSPKSGKSSLARRLALDVALGTPYMGRYATRQAPVLYYTLQENKQHLHKWFQSALASYDVLPETIPLDFIFRLGKRGTGALDGLRNRIRRNAYGLIVLDMFGRFAGLSTLDDYAEVENYLDKLKSITDETGACVLWLHHERKAGGAFEGGIGSQAIRGAVYTTLKTWKEKGKYWLATEQRDGEDLAPVSIVLDKETQRMNLGMGAFAAAIVESAEDKSLEQRVHAVLEADPQASQRAVLRLTGGKTSTVARIIKEWREARTKSK